MVGVSIDKYREQHPEKPSRGTIYNWINKGYLEFYRLPSGRIRITGEKKRPDINYEKFIENLHEFGGSE